MKQLLKIYSLIVVLCLLVGMLLIAVPWQNFYRRDLTVIATFALNGGVWGLLLFFELTKRAYSLLIIHWLFCFLFFFCIAFVQYMYGIFPWIISRQDNLILYTNLILLGWTFFVWIGYKLATSKKYKISTTSTQSIYIPQWLVLGLTGFTLINTVYRLATVGFSALLSHTAVSYGVESSAIRLLMGHTLQALSFFATVFTFIYYRQRKRNVVLVGIAFICLVVSYFPTALSRYAAAAIYGGLLLITFSSLRKNRVFIVALVIGFLVIFPFLNAFRGLPFADVNILSTIQRVLENLAEDWLAGDYDAYAMLTLTLEHIQRYGITVGMQLLGVLFFWVPRSLWVNKPIGTGAFISSQLGWQFTNLSAPLPAEALISWGGGYLLFAAVLGWLMGKLDMAYWNDIDRTGQITRKQDILYPILIMFFFFMNRGDLLSSTAYMMAYVAVWWILCKWCKIRYV